MIILCPTYQGHHCILDVDLHPNGLSARSAMGTHQVAGARTVSLLHSRLFIKLISLVLVYYSLDLPHRCLAKFKASWNPEASKSP